MPANDHSPDPTGRMLWYLVPLGIVVVLLAVGIVTVSALNDAGRSSDAGDVENAKSVDGNFWTVKRGQTLSTIAQRTGLTVEQLEAFNPQVDASRIAPGTRLKLQENVPRPQPKPHGPRFRVVHSGESFGSIAEDVGRSISQLRRLNPNLKPSELRPGDRMRLRR